MKDRVSIELKDGVADVRLIRADKMNALDPAMFEGIIAAGATADDEGPALRRAVGRGQGVLRRPRHGKLRGDEAGRRRACRACATSRSARTASPTGRSNAPGCGATLPVPVIAAVHGVAFGGGFQIALGADMRYATADTRFSVMEIKWGLVPDLAGTQLMRHLAREDVVRELTYTGRIFDGDGGAADGLRHPRGRRSARRGVRDGEGNRRQESRRHARGQAAAQSSPSRPTPRRA